jgi:hypothetical protein
MSNWEASVSWTRDAVLEGSRAPDLVCKVLERERASEKGGTEGVDSAIKGQSLLPSGLRHIRGNEVIERSPPRYQRMRLAGERAERNLTEPTGFGYSVTNFIPLPCSVWEIVSQGATPSCGR